MRQTKIRNTILFATMLLGFFGGSRSLEARSWALFDAACDQGTSQFEVSCGDYGTFHFLDIVDPPGCERLAEGDHTGPYYPLPMELEPFPAEPTQTLIGRSDVPQQFSDEPYLVGIDFDSVHGTSTSYVSDEVSGPAIASELVFLDDVSVATLGPGVGDEHLVAALCRIVETIDVDGRGAPLMVNMSFGRAVQESDPVSAEGDGNSIPAQVAKVVAHLNDREVEFAAALGNHQEKLFPAVLEEVAGIGALDMNSFFETGLPKLSWETPSGADALMPAGSLCLRGGWPAPAGTSYSSAIFSGWLASIRLRRPGIKATDGELWAPQWWPDRNCHTLALDGAPYSRCNQAIDSFIEGLQGVNRVRCWGDPEPRDEAIQPSSPVDELPEFESFDSWVAISHPTPESDPCVPCVGDPIDSFVSQWDDFLLNLSRSPALPDPIVVDAVYLRIDEQFYPIELPQETLELIAAGQVDSLHFSQWGGEISATQQSSLVYVLKNETVDDCFAGGSPQVDCFWSATPILWLLDVDEAY